LLAATNPNAIAVTVPAADTATMSGQPAERTVLTSR